MVELTPEMQQAIDSPIGKPAEVTDPHTNATYLLVRSEDWAKAKAAFESDVCPDLTDRTRRALAALRRDLPELLTNPRNRGENVCYHLETRLGMSRDYLSLVRECIDRGLPEDEWIVMTIEPGVGAEVIDL